MVAGEGQGQSLNGVRCAEWDVKGKWCEMGVLGEVEKGEM
jgi:hypothetical protein